MAVIIQYTSPTLGDNLIHDNGDVFTDGTLNATAIVDVYTNPNNGIETTRVDLTANGIWDVNATPTFISLTIEREGDGYRARFSEYDFAEGVNTGMLALQVWAEPDAQGANLYTTSIFQEVLVDDGEGNMIPQQPRVWETTNGSNPHVGNPDIHFSVWYENSLYSAFTLHDNFTHNWFSGAGDWEAAIAATDLDDDGNPDTPVMGVASVDRISITEDADSVNIDVDGDGDADIVLPK